MGGMKVPFQLEISMAAMSVFPAKVFPRRYRRPNPAFCKASHPAGSSSRIRSGVARSTAPMTFFRSKAPCPTLTYWAARLAGLGPHAWDPNASSGLER